MRKKLLLISAVLFIAPWLGVQYIQDMENYLRINQQNDLLGRAQIVAAVLQGQADIFQSRFDKKPDTRESVDLQEHNNAQKQVHKNNVNYAAHLYVRPQKNAIQLDGYLDDWLDFDEKAILIQSKNPSSLQYKYYLSSYKKYLYMVLSVKDDQVVYRKGNSLSLSKNDHLIIKMRDKEGELQTYFIATQSPGWINAQRMQKHKETWQVVAPEYRIKGEWQETLEGYNIEIRIPLSLIGEAFSFYVADVDYVSGMLSRVILGEAGIDEPLGTIIIPSIKVENMLSRIVRPASRTWVIDKKFRVLAVAGNIKSAPVGNVQDILNENEGIMSQLVSVFYHLLLKQPDQNFTDDLLGASYLRGEAVQSALHGKPSTRWRETPDKRVRILTASYPVVVNGETVGAIAIEETSHSILILQNRAMEILINLSVLTFLITMIVLLGYATSLSVRIRRLRDETKLAISNDGRIEKQFTHTRSSDEIGDLSRSFSDMLNRLHEYNRYLETMAGKLSHELRTPITVVRSSLDNLKMASTDDAREVYIQRASDGMARLSDVLTRMSEATRLEQTLQSEHLQNVNISQLITSCMAGYKMAYSNVNFELENHLEGFEKVSGVAELLAQMLDKLISNAVDFHEKGTSVFIKLSKQKKQIRLSVINYGQPLPEDMRRNLFESMVSVRNKKDGEPHLGLGLYIVRMIVEFHQGEVEALNLSNNKGVEIKLSFPLL